MIAMDHFLLLYHQPVIGITPRVGVFFNLAFCHLHLHLNLRFGYWRWLSNSRSNNECLVFADLGRDPAIKRNGLSCRPPGLERPINFSPTTNSHTYTGAHTTLVVYLYCGELTIMLLPVLRQEITYILARQKFIDPVHVRMQ
jgi:hypothetical protein